MNMVELALPKDDFSPPPIIPTTAEEAKRKKRPQKAMKSPRPANVSPQSSDGEKQRQKQKQTIDSPCAEQSSTPTPPAPPLSISSPQTRNKSSKKSSSKSSSKSSNKSISNRSPRTDLKHRQVASAAAEVAGIRRQRRPRKKLNWNNSVRVKVVHNLGNYTTQEKFDSWYTADEYSMMEDECELTSIHMDEISNVIPEEENSQPFERALPPGFCERGLESWTMQGEEIKEQQVQLVIDTVWQAQIDAWEFLGDHSSKSEPKSLDDQSEYEVYSECWEFIRERASAVSRVSQRRARDIAKKDVQAVASYLNPVRSLEQSRRRITKMLRGKNCSSRSITRSSKTLTTSKSFRTVATVSSSSSSYTCSDNLKSILKSSKPRRSYSDTRAMRRSSSQSQIPLKSTSEHSKAENRSRGSFRIPLGNDSSSLLSKSLRSNSLRSNSLRSNSLRSNSLRSNLSRSNSMRSSSLRSSNLSPSQSLRSSLSRSSRSNGNNSVLGGSARSNGNSVLSNLSGNSLLSNSSKKIRYKPKSKIKIPTSPVGSVCNSLLSNQSQSNHTLTDEEDLSNRMMRSHMSLSLGSEGSSRRRMLRASTPSPPL